MTGIERTVSEREACRGKGVFHVNQSTRKVNDNTVKSAYTPETQGDVEFDGDVDSLLTALVGEEDLVLA